MKTRTKLLTFGAVLALGAAGYAFTASSEEAGPGYGPPFIHGAMGQMMGHRMGAGMMSMWGQTLYGSGWATGQDRELGTLEPTISAPTPYLWVVLGRIVWNTVVVGRLCGGRSTSDRV